MNQIQEFNPNSLDAQFSALSVKLDALAEQIKALPFQSHENRLLVIENFLARQKGWIAGAMCVAGGIGSVLAVVGEWLFRKSGSSH